MKALGPALFATTALVQLMISRALLSRRFVAAVPKAEALQSTFSSSRECDACEVPKDPKPLRSLKDTVTPYKRHAILCMPEPVASWPRAIEAEGSIALRLSDALKLYKSKQFAVKLSGCTYSSPSTGSCVILYPEGVIVDVIPENIESFAKIVTKQSSLSGEDFHSFSVKPVPWKKLVLCCIHASRDQRCGNKGVQVFESLQAELNTRGIPSTEIAVYGSSHLGGHEFAGTLVSYPSGNWYGYLSKEKIPKLVDCLINDQILDECHRGTGCNSIQW